MGNIAFVTLTFLYNFLLNADVANADTLEDNSVEDMLADTSFLNLFLDLFSD